MKKIFLPLSIIFALGIRAYDAQAQTQISPSDSTLLSESVQGEYLVRRYKIINTDDEAQFTLRYTVAAAKLPSLSVGNVAEVIELDEMMAKIQQDPSMHISRIEITGYASPDGNATSNERLALSRAEQFRAWLEERYSLANAYTLQTRADAEQWSACDAAVESSQLADKDKILSILNSSATESSKEQQLKSIPTAWSLFRTQILPAMRRVEMTVYYNVDRIVEVRTLIEKPKPQIAPQIARRCPCSGFVDDPSIGIIVDMSNPYEIY